jgi:CRISPR-associated exonuclease Cas4
MIELMVAGGVLILLLIWVLHRSGAPRGSSLVTAGVATSRRLSTQSSYSGHVVLITLTAKVDRGYRDPAGIIILVELKNRQRDRVSPSDVIELSAQRVAVMAETGGQVALHAYVIVQGPSGRRVVHRVGLLDVVEVGALIQRRESILIGRATPRCSRSVRLCRGCGFLRRCTELPWCAGP